MTKEKLYRREDYLSKIRGFYHDTELIKVITGVRRSGKSCLMKCIALELQEGGVPSKNIIFINLDKRGYRSVKTADALEKVIESLSAEIKGEKYLFIDEIQNVKDFEEVLNGFREDGDYSIFITGSNSYLLSGDLVTKLTGRYLEFELYTLSFSEYLAMKKFLGKEVNSDLFYEFDQYILEGGFPKALDFEGEDKAHYIKGVIQEIFEKDIRKRVRLRNISVFETVSQYIMNNFGATISISNIISDLEKSGCNIKRETLFRYIKVLENAKILYPCKRFDLKSKKSLKTEQKYYLADLGFYYAMNVDKRINYGPALENIVYMYAKSKGYDVSVGKIGNLECDFILHKGFNYAYVQVAMTIMNSLDTENREYRPFELIKDNYPKYLLTRNDLIQYRDGIEHYNLAPFLEGNKEFSSKRKD